MSAELFAFVEIGIIVLIATVISVFMKYLRQPLIIGYIITGIIISPYFLDLIASKTQVLTFAQIGIAMLLFMVGLELNPKVIRDVGKVSLITGVGQVVFTSTIGIFIALLLGFTYIESVYIAVAMAFSSTIIIMKLLGDKGDLEKLYGKISIGFLLVQDVIALFILMIISATIKGGSVLFILYTILQGIIFVGFLFLFSKYVFPYLLEKSAKSQEFLFLFSISWNLMLAVIFLKLGFSFEIGALLAGVTISLTPYANEISSKMKPLRDFFLIMFFIVLGLQMTFGSINEQIIPIIIFSLFILIGNPLIVIIIMKFLKYNIRNGFRAGLAVAQISEFSLILISLGVFAEHLTPKILSFTTFVGIITIAGSTYFIQYEREIYNFLLPIIRIFEKNSVEYDICDDKSYDTIILGYNRMGYDIVESLEKSKKDYLIIDYDPEIIKNLKSKNKNCIFADLGNTHTLDCINFKGAKNIISTIPDHNTSRLILKHIRKVNPNSNIILVSENIICAKDLYENGADYVVIPKIESSQKVTQFINNGMEKKELQKENKIAKKYIENRIRNII